MFGGMDPSTMWRMLRRSGYVKANDSPFRLGGEELNNHFLVVSNCVLPVDSEPWANLSFEGSLSLSWVSCHKLNVVPHKIKSKSLGDDGIPILFIKLVFPYIAKLVMFHVNSILA
uniref:Uncharacterized protein n=1 Tax=Glossina palpalis gambiensis TaxID=67801 RepID=A0A1B0BFC5_9MUSC